MSNSVNIAHLRSVFALAQDNGLHQAGLTCLSFDNPEAYTKHFENLQTAILGGWEGSITCRHQKIFNLTMFWAAAMEYAGANKNSVSVWNTIWRDDKKFIDQCLQREALEINIAEDLAEDYSLQSGSFEQLLSRSHKVINGLIDLKNCVFEGRPVLQDPHYFKRNGMDAGKCILISRQAMATESLRHVAIYTDLADTMASQVRLIGAHIMPYTTKHPENLDAAQSGTTDEMSNDLKQWQGFLDQNCALGQDALEVASMIQDSHVPRFEHFPQCLADNKLKL